MSHTGIRLKITINGQAVLEGDSDWLHMMAVYSEGLPEPSMADLMENKPIEPKWHEYFGHSCDGGLLRIFVQPVSLPDEYPDDEDQAEVEPS